MNLSDISPVFLSELNEINVGRLLRISEKFDIQINFKKDGYVDFSIFEKEGLRNFRIVENLAHARLATEICSKTLRWIHYKPNRCCISSLLEQPDERLDRVAELYARWKLAGFPV